MFVKYSLDTNVFVESSKRYYSFDIAPPFWDALALWGRQENIFCVKPVYDEIIEGNNDRLCQWARTDAYPMFIEPDEDTYEELTNIANHVMNNYLPHIANPFLSCADPLVIAFAKAKDLTVVTMEIMKQEVRNSNGLIGGKKIQIPNICHNLGIQCIDTFQFLRNQRFSFR